MTSFTPQRQTLIEAKQAEAARLLSLANQESMKDEIRRISRALDDPSRWLKQPDTTRSILASVDRIVTQADERLRVVAGALNGYGPDALLVGRYQ